MTTCLAKRAVGLLVTAVLLCGTKQVCHAQMTVTSARIAKSSARNYIQERLPEKALEMARIAVGLEPDDAEARFMLGALYAKKEMLEEMNEQFEACLALERGGRYLERGIDVDGADEFLFGGIRVTRESLWRRYYNAGVVALNGAERPTALVEFGRARTALPDRVATCLALGQTYVAMDSLDTALAQYRTAIDIDGTDAQGWAGAGIALLRSGRNSDAVSYLGRAHQLAPERDDIGRAYADACRRAGDVQRALVVAEGMLQQDASNGPALALAGALCVETKDYNKAVEYLEKALDRTPADREVAFNLANAYLGQGRADRSVALFERFLQSAAGDADVLYHLGALYDRAGQFDKAIEALTGAVAARPQWAPGWKALYVAYAHKSAATTGTEAKEAAMKAEEALAMEQSIGEQGQ